MTVRKNAMRDQGSNRRRGYVTPSTAQRRRSLAPALQEAGYVQPDGTLRGTYSLRASDSAFALTDGIIMVRRQVRV
jgi:hypothetical protein